MKCPKCGCTKSNVVDSRQNDNYSSIKRRRECPKCGNRFTTFETYEYGDSTPMVVIKKDGSPEIFDRNKIVNGLIKACYKRPVTTEQIGQIADSIENELKATLRSEFRSEEIGLLVMEKLKKLDDVSYVRFASVYREFKDVDTFMEELKQISKDK